MAQRRPILSVRPAGFVTVRGGYALALLALAGIALPASVIVLFLMLETLRPLPKR